MHMLQKVAHMAFTEGKDPKEAVYRYLLSYRTTPHSTTGRTSAELFNRRIVTTIPFLKKNELD